MSRALQKIEATGKLLDCWDPPKAGLTPIGCLATTYTFSPAFFEEECLGRFLGLESDPKQDGPLYLIEREEKLAQLAFSGALVDQHHCQGGRNLRWDLLAARPAKGILHAKIAILLWSEYLRIVISSANLTEDGYRRNREVFGILDYHPESNAPYGCIGEVVAFVRECLETTGLASYSGGRGRADGFLGRVESVSEAWGTPAESRAVLRTYTLFSSPTRRPVFDQLGDFWPVTSPPTEAIVTSPFFDCAASDNPPARVLWELLARRGFARVTYNVIAEALPEEGAILLHAPDTLRTAQPQGSRNLATEFRTIEPDAQRPLHAKTVLLLNDTGTLYMLGSSNFTSRGMGLAHHPNYEANLVYSVRADRNQSVAHRLLAAQLKSESIAENIEERFCGAEEEEDAAGNQAVLPQFFGSAILGIDSEGRHNIELTFGKTPPTKWDISKEEGESLYSSTIWAQESNPDSVRISWSSPRLSSGLLVQWDGDNRAWWPVNIISQELLPPPEGLRDLSLEFLMRALTSARPLHVIMKEYQNAKRLDQFADDDEKNHLDPHKRVDTANFLLQRTRRVAGALRGIRDRLERPVPSEASLQWRLRGPIGVVEFARALKREHRSAAEYYFLLAEIILELRRVQPASAAGCLSPKCVRAEVDAVARELSAEVDRGRSEVAGNLVDYLALVTGAEGMKK